MSPAEPALRFAGLTAGYGDTAVVRDLDLEVAPGEVLALVGPNGAGKTTLLRTASGLLPPLAGEVVVLGDPAPHRWPHRVARAGVAHVVERGGSFPSLSPREHLRLAGGRGRGAPQAAVADATARFPALEPLLDRPTGRLSGGEQQMLALAVALVRRPRLLLVDELSLGLAPRVVHHLVPALRQVADDDGCAVVLVEQQVAVALSVADRVAVLRGGRLAALGPAGELRGDPDALRRSYLG